MSRSKSNCKQPAPGELTLLLTDVNYPDRLQAVMSLTYDEMRSMAGGQLRREHAGHSWQ
jgi:hypothetical protein